MMCRKRRLRISTRPNSMSSTSSIRRRWRSTSAPNVRRFSHPAARSRPQPNTAAARMNSGRSSLRWRQPLHRGADRGRQELRLSDSAHLPFPPRGAAGAGFDRDDQSAGTADRQGHPAAQEADRHRIQGRARQGTAQLSVPPPVRAALRRTARRAAARSGACARHRPPRAVDGVHHRRRTRFDRFPA